MDHERELALREKAHELHVARLKSNRERVVAGYLRLIRDWAATNLDEASAIFSVPVDVLLLLVERTDDDLDRLARLPNVLHVRLRPDDIKRLLPKRRRRRKVTRKSQAKTADAPELEVLADQIVAMLQDCAR